MAERNCKNCINGDVCLFMYHNPVAEHCSFYKDKKQFVNVVRCEECEYRIKDDVGRYFCELGDFYVGETDYCSRGTPKERGGEK